jgi:predicted TPR repeat methyltransferase
VNWNNDTIRELERRSIRAFVAKQRGYLKGRVLDFGAGKPGTCREPQPYSDLVAGEYLPFDLGDTMPTTPFDAVLMTQVLQYIEAPADLLCLIRGWLVDGGHLICTYQTNWDEVEPADLWRFTRSGMEKLLRDAGFAIVAHERRAEVNLGGFRFALGHGVVARAG